MADNVKIKDPDAKLDYGIDWSSWLVDSDVIVASTWIIPTGITKVSDTFNDTTSIVWLSGGTVGTVYSLVNHITTQDSREDDRTIYINMQEK